MPTFHQHSETDRLKRVIIGSPKGYAQHPEYIEIVNETQKKGLPDSDLLHEEFDRFQEVLEAHGVEVVRPDYVGKFVYDQLTPRDLGMTIGQRFLLCNMARASRRYEAAGIFSHLAQMKGPEPAILIPPDPNIRLEGGDLLLDRGNLYVGISQRTNRLGYSYLQHQFGRELKVVPVYCTSLAEGEDILHLDCTFNPIGKSHALIYPDGFQQIPESIEQDYSWIEINREEQAHLATNVLSIDPQTVISRDHPACERVNRAMEVSGLKVIRLPFDGAPSTGGSLRCCSLPLVRET